MSNSPSSTEETPTEAWVDLRDYCAPDFIGRGFVVRLTWLVVSWIVFESRWFVLGGVKPTILRWFGAQLGSGVVIKPQVKIKFPWRLTAGDCVWIGEETWIDNLAQVTLGSHVCISQGVYFCTGSHNYRSRQFELVTTPITVENGAWIAARSTLVGGVTIGANALVAAGSLVAKDVEPASIVGGNPAKLIKPRQQPS